MRILLVILVGVGLAGCSTVNEGVANISAQFNRGLSGGGQVFTPEIGPQH